jgi:Leucine-rich repeat (LRR) protein
MNLVEGVLDTGKEGLLENFDRGGGGSKKTIDPHILRRRSFECEMIEHEGVVHNTSCREKSSNCKNLYTDLVIILIVIFSIALLHILMYYERSNYFLDPLFSRPLVWIHFMIFLYAVFLIIYILCKAYTRRCRDHNEINKRNTKGKHDDKCVTKCKTNILKSHIFAACYRHMKWLQELKDKYLHLNSKYFIVKVYCMEMIQHCFTLWNLISEYTCLMEFREYIIIAIILFIKTFIGIMILLNKKEWIRSNVARNLFLIFILVSNMLLLAVPLAITFFAFKIPFTVVTLLKTTAYTSISLLLKLNSVAKDAIDRSKDQCDINYAEVDQIVKTQVNFVPRWTKYVFVGFDTIVLSTLFVTIFIQSARLPSDKDCIAIYGDQVWQSCYTKVPFCQSIFKSACDCTSIYMSNYPHGNLSANFGRLKSLRDMKIIGGNLIVLPYKFGHNHKHLIEVAIVETNLITIPSTIGALSQLLKLDLRSNAIADLPKEISSLQNLYELRLGKNKISDVSVLNSNLRSLVRLDLSKNALTELPSTSFSGIPNLVELYLDSNRLKMIPTWMFSQFKHLKFLSFHTNLLTTWPTMLDTSYSMKFLDLRYNNISWMPPQNGKFSLYKLNTIYFTGNPGCHDILTKLDVIDCQPECAPICRVSDLGNGICDDDLYIYYAYERQFPNAISPENGSSCYSSSCNFDDGDCDI